MAEEGVFQIVELSTGSHSSEEEEEEVRKEHIIHRRKLAVEHTQAHQHRTSKRQGAPVVSKTWRGDFLQYTPFFFSLLLCN